MWISHVLPCPPTAPSKSLGHFRRSNHTTRLSLSLLSLAPSAACTPVLRIVSLLITCSAVESLEEPQKGPISALMAFPRLFPCSRGHPTYSMRLSKLVLFIPTVTQRTCYLLVVHQAFKAQVHPAYTIM